MDFNYNQPVDQVPARVPVIVKDAHTHAPVTHWIPLDGETYVIRPEDFQ